MQFTSIFYAAATLLPLAMASPLGELDARQTVGQQCVLYWQLGLPGGGASTSGCQSFTLGGTGRQTLRIGVAAYPNCQISFDTTPNCRDFRIAGVSNCGDSRSFQFGAPGEIAVCNP